MGLRCAKLSLKQTQSYLGHKGWAWQPRLVQSKHFVGVCGGKYAENIWE